MTRELGMAVICEGVETEEPAPVLQKLGCFLTQGFYYYRPMPVKDLEEIMFPRDVLGDLWDSDVN